MTKRKESGPSQIKEALAKYLKNSGLGEQIEAISVIPEWPNLVGPAIAAVTTPISVSQGVLVIAVRSSAWMNELKMMEREITRRVNVGRARGRIEKIRFQMSE